MTLGQKISYFILNLSTLILLGITIWLATWIYDVL